MARFTPTAADTVVADWQSGDYFDETLFREQVGQNLEFLMQSHDHSGDLGDGGTLPISDPKQIWWWAPAPGSPFA